MVKTFESKINKTLLVFGCVDLEALRTIFTTSLKPDVKVGKHRPASVLVVIYGEEPFIIMTKKPEDLKIHAGEISFPGGKWESADNDLLDTAIRETREEIGLSVSRKNVIGQLENVTTLNSGFSITPFVSILNDIGPLESNTEVESILKIPLMPFLKTISIDNDPSHQSLLEMYTLKFQDKIVWGASARILKQMVNRLNL